MAQLWFQRFNTGEENIKDSPSSGRSKLRDIENIRRVLEEIPQKKALVASKNPYISRLRHLEDHTEAVELTPQQVQLRVDISRQHIGNPMNDRCIRRTVTRDAKWVCYSNSDA